MENPKINQVVKYRGKRWKVISFLPDSRVRIQCIQCTSKYADVSPSELVPA